MTSPATLEAVEFRIKAADERISSELSRLSGVLQRLGGVVQRRSLALDGLLDDLGSLRRRFDEKKLVLVVCGATSAGKSTLINAVLRRDLLFTAPEHCTPCSVSIEAGSSPRAFFTEGKWFEGCQERDIAQLHDSSDAKSKSAAVQPLFVFLPIVEHQDSALRIANLRLVDSPGLNESVAEDCVDLEGDAFAFVVDFDAGVNWETLQQQLHARRDKAVFFVFNRCDSVELFDCSRFEQGRAEKLDRAVHFLTENRIFPDAAAAAASVFFLSARLAVLQRKNEAVLQELQATISRSCAAQKTPQLLVCGGPEVGKTSLCNELVGCDVLPLRDAPCSVRLQLSGAAGDSPELQDLRADLEARLREATNDVLCASVPEPLLPPHSLLRHGVVVVDSSGEAFPPDVAPAVVALVISGSSGSQKQQRSVERCLERCGGAARLLVVTKMNELRSNQGAERARRVEADIRDLWRRLADSEAVFFLEKEPLMAKYGAAFDAFEQHLVAAGHERFAELKLKRIEDAATEAATQLNAELCGATAELEAMEATFRAAPGALLDSAAAQDVSSTQVDRFLRGEALPRDNADVEAIVTRFLDFLRSDLAQQLQMMGEAPLQALGRVDGRVQEAGRALLEADIAALQVEEEVELQQLQDALPPPREEMDAAEERLRTLQARRSEVARSRADLERRRERVSAGLENAAASRRERSAEVAGRAEQRRSKEAQIGAWRREGEALRAEMEAARRDREQAEAEADAARLEADKWAAEAAATDEIIRGLSHTIKHLDRPLTYLLNTKRALRCPEVRRKRSEKEHEASAHRIREKEARARQQEKSAKAERLEASRGEQQRALNGLEQKIALISAQVQETAAEAAEAERRGAAAAAEAAEAEKQLSGIDEELQEISREAHEVDNALQEADEALKELQQRWAAKMEGLPRALRAQLDELVQRATRKALQGLRATLERFAEAEIAELRCERSELEKAVRGET